MDCLFCKEEPATAIPPSLIIELPPQALRFSNTNTDAPVFFASIAAANPANPVPITITSVFASQSFP